MGQNWQDWKKPNGQVRSGAREAGAKSAARNTRHVKPEVADSITTQ